MGIIYIYMPGVVKVVTGTTCKSQMISGWTYTHKVHTHKFKQTAWKGKVQKYGNLKNRNRKSG